MKINLNIEKLLLLVFLLGTTLTKGQIVLNPNPNNGSCNLGTYGAVNVSVPSEALTGDNIALNITLPGTLPSNCTKTVKITRTSNLDFQSSGSIPFSPVIGDPLSYENTTPLAGNDGQNFNVFFKFPAFVTCNNTIGTFTVTVTATCGTVTTTCTTTVNVKARAANYWSISKEFYTGDLTCGTSKWIIKVTHNNPNPTGLGTYSLSGTINETATVPIVSGSTFSLNYSGAYNGTYYNWVTLQNCANNGSTITNTANYNFTLGSNCETMTGSISATSPPLANPNASISFVKSVANPAFYNLTPGCDAYYNISVCNNGNVPWTNISITDNLNIPGLTITNVVLPSGWTSSPLIPSSPPVGFFNQSFTFTAPSGLILNPGDCASIWIYFTINNSTAIGSNITNSASLSYQAAGTSSGGNNSGGPSPCPSINCPTITTAVQNTTSSVNFVVEQPKAIPNIKKCIINPPNSLNPPIYQIGNTIEFKLIISNSGSADLNTTVTDVLSGSGQNLQFIPGSITYTYYDDEYYGNIYSCNPNFGTPSPINSPFSITNTSTSPSLDFAISNMPGICDFNKANFLVITYKAKILPQLSGTKTNTALLNTKSSSVNYSIDQVGILEIDKKADTEFADNGQSFNYILTVSNNGSVPLNTISVNDNLPSCVTRNGQISVKNGIGSPVPFSTTGNITINISPSTQIQPGESFVITIPVKMTGGGNCCNIEATVSAKMITSGVILNANDGSTTAPAACVKSTECCDIEGFEASINNQNGAYNVVINGGPNPLQEIDISIVDYHVEYSNENCKPDNMGIFGLLSTSTNLLSNLLFEASSNNSHSLNWGLGSPSIINGSVQINITEPLVLNLDCCEVKFYFCLKVRAKDVNCNVCEKIICYSPEVNEKPCDLTMSELPQGKKYCPGDSVTLNWSGTTPSSQVTIYLYNNATNSIYQTIATGLPDSGTYTFSLPTTLPCDPPQNWSFIIEDATKKCLVRSSIFTVECCTTSECECGEWKTDFITIKSLNKENPTNSQLKSNFINNTQGKQIPCNGSQTLKSGVIYNFTAPNYVCNPSDCEVVYNWKIELNGTTVYTDSGNNINYTFMGSGNYIVKVTPICGTTRCKPCEIRITIDKQGNDYLDQKFKINKN